MSFISPSDPNSMAHNPNTHTPMAGTDSVLQLNPTADQPPELQLLLPPPSPVLRSYYEVEYARFFPFSKPESNGDHPLLQRRQKISPSDGTWISSPSASLQLFFCDTSGSQTPPQLVLVISARRKILEEHYISKLHFSWPQMSCVSQNHMTGSRVVFASYRNSLGQAEKFAMRFFNTSESQSFIDLLKESLLGVREIGRQCSNMQSESQLTNEFVNSYHSILSIVPSITDGMEHASSAQAVSRDVYRVLCPSPILPPSFTNLLAESSSEAQEPAMSNGVDFVSQITKYMTTASFQDMLSMVEKVINDMGGDLTL